MLQQGLCDVDSGGINSDSCVTGPTFRDRCGIPVSDSLVDGTRLLDARQ